MKQAFAFILAVLTPASPVAADVVGPGGKVQDCYCTDSRGSRVELGETICLQVDGRMFMAQCQMSLNVPMWREVQEGCLSSRLPPRLQSINPAFDLGPINTKI
ncbi:hypothetical protein [Primorskyibacter sp. S87]|uniref:hypothetical protein n=1 Tax=Primorskyibacter sp. S87 TaxID=3415126 RepID=UPI003C7D9CB3